MHTSESRKTTLEAVVVVPVKNVAVGHVPVATHLVGNAVLLLIPPFQEEVTLALDPEEAALRHMIDPH